MQISPFIHLKVKLSSLQITKAHEDVDERAPIFSTTAQRRGRVASPTLGHLYIRKTPGTHFTGS